MNHLSLFSFRKLQTVWASKVVGLKVTLQLYTCNFPYVALYVFETWKVTTKITNLLNMCNLSFLHKIAGMSREDKLWNAESKGLSDRWETSTLSWLVSSCTLLRVNQHRLPWMGHSNVKREPQIDQRRLGNSKRRSAQEGDILVSES